MKRVLNIVVSLVAFIATVAHAETKPTPAPSAKPQTSGIDLNKALDVLQLKIDMAENTVRIRPTLPNISELVAALEKSINTNCLKKLPRTLKWEGNPTDPTCVQRMERLLELNPDNPAAICYRDGIKAESCVNAYAGQELVVWNTARSFTPDPALRVGLSASEMDELRKREEVIGQMTAALERAPDDAARDEIFEAMLPVYDLMLGTACRINILQLERKSGVTLPEDDSEYKRVKERLLKIPKHLRKDYQDKTREEYEEKIAKSSSANTIKRYRAIQRLADDPEATPAVTSDWVGRIRYVLPRCGELLNTVTQVAPIFPTPTCHREGWYSPQCITALENWRKFNRSRPNSKRKDGDPESKKKDSLIDEF